MSSLMSETSLQLWTSYTCGKGTAKVLMKRLVCRLLFTQYKNTWLVRKRLCRLLTKINKK